MQIAPAVSVKPHRHTGLEFGRVVSAAGIVWLHAAGTVPRFSGWGNAGRYAVPYFTLVAFLFLTRSVLGNSKSLKSYRKFSVGRFLRLYLPFLVWTAAYLLARHSKELLTGQPAAFPEGPFMLFTGSAHHLWYLPFLFISSIVAWPIIVLADRLHSRLSCTLIFLLMGAGACFFPLDIPYRADDPAFSNQIRYTLLLGLHAFPSALFGVAMAFANPRITLASTRWIVAVSGIVALLVFQARICLVGNSLLEENLAGASLFAACLVLPRNPIVDRLALWGNLTFGIYLWHILIILGVQSTVGNFIVRSPAIALTIYCCTGFFASLFLTKAMKKTAATRWLV